MRCDRFGTPQLGSLASTGAGCTNVRQHQSTQTPFWNDIPNDPDFGTIPGDPSVELLQAPNPQFPLSTTCFASPQEQDLIEGTNIVMGYVGGELEWEMTERHRRFDAAVTDIRKCKNEKELSEQLKIWWLAIRGCAFHDLKPLVDFATKYKLIEEQDNGERPSKRWMRGSREFVVSNKVLENNLPEEDFKTQRDEFVKLLYGQGAFSKQYDEGNLTKRAFMRKEDTWLAIYDILKSESVFTCSMTDLAGCHKQMEAASQSRLRMRAFCCVRLSTRDCIAMHGSTECSCLWIC